MVKKEKAIRRHTVSASLQVVELTKATTALELVVKSNRQTIGTLVIGRGSIEWFGGNRKTSKRISWTRFAAMMDQLAYGSTSAAVRKAKTDTGTHKNGSKEKKKPPGQSKSTFLAPLQPSVALAAIVGSGPLPRTQVVKRLWRYIRRHGLQDAGNKRMINADGVLRKVLDGKKQVSMFDMIKLVNKHLS